MAVIASVKAKGVARYQACALLQIKVRRIEWWEEKIRRTGSMEYSRSGPKQVVHAIMPVERVQSLPYQTALPQMDYHLGC